MSELNDNERRYRFKIVCDYLDVFEQDELNKIGAAFHEFCKKIEEDSNVKVFYTLNLKSVDKISAYIDFEKKMLVRTIRKFLVKCGFESKLIKIKGASMGAKALLTQYIHQGIIGDNLPYVYYRHDATPFNDINSLL